ncbi:GntR family transcriptional regulator [Thermoactinospora rubra]|uniref:GntR family transcriptional regulator n=1 Tax=Thermoactinospora rubra TaxID=1088767 RepID=UPI000A11FFA4|nr:GntR family transcriptional regulator [Thermoactinospora rubra]
MQAPLSKADYVYRVLLEEIRTARLPGGTALRASAIAERLGVSVTPVREALRRLERDRLVRYEPHHGATVADLSEGALEEFYGVRAVLEGFAARLAAAKITPGQLERLRALHESMVRDHAEGRLQALGAKSRELHLAVADIGGPAFLGQQVRAVREAVPIPAEASLWLDPDLAARHLRAHERLLAALAAADGEAAEQIMAEHVRQGAADRVARRRQSQQT